MKETAGKEEELVRTHKSITIYGTIQFPPTFWTMFLLEKAPKSSPRLFLEILVTLIPKVIGTLL